MNLKEFYDYKNQLMNHLLTNEKIVGLIRDGATVDNAASLMYTQVFPYEYVPETTEVSTTYVCSDVDITSAENKTFLYPTLYVWVFTHKSLLRLPEGGVRTDELASAICEAINGSMLFGLGQLEFYSSKRFAPMTDYQGKCLVFHAKDFNRQYDPNRFIPGNRKLGR